MQVLDTKTQFRISVMMTKIFSLIKSIKFALKGIVYAIKNERNMRIHTVAAIFVLFLSAACGINSIEYAILILTIGLVVICEMFNTVIESFIDLCAKEYNSIAKIAKDMSAGAVMVSAMAAVVVGFIFFGKKEAYTKLWAIFCSSPFVFIFVLILFFLFSYIYIFLGPTEIKNKIKSIAHTLKKAINNNKDGNINEN